MTNDAPESGLAEVYRQQRVKLLRFLVARTGDPLEAEDVVQELWIRISTSKSGPITNESAYLFRVAHNLVLDRVRERKRRATREKNWSTTQHGPLSVSGEIADDRESIAEEVEARDEAARLASAIATLPDGARRVLRLHKIEGLSHGEVAAALGISKSGVEKHMAVAMKYLRRAMAED